MYEKKFLLRLPLCYFLLTMGKSSEMGTALAGMAGASKVPRATGKDKGTGKRIDPLINLND